MTVNLLPLCSSQKPATRTGDAGAFARVYVPFNRYWFANGNEYTFPSTNLPANLSTVTAGQNKPDTFMKAAGICIGA